MSDDDKVIRNPNGSYSIPPGYQNPFENEKPIAFLMVDCVMLAVWETQAAMLRDIAPMLNEEGRDVMETMADWIEILPLALVYLPEGWEERMNRDIEDELERKMAGVQRLREKMDRIMQEHEDQQ